MKNFYANGYCTTGIRDGHDWGPPRTPDWDGARCRDCGVEASNASIARGQNTHDNSPISDCTVKLTYEQLEAEVERLRKSEREGWSKAVNRAIVLARISEDASVASGGMRIARHDA